MHIVYKAYIIPNGPITMTNQESNHFLFQYFETLVIFGHKFTKSNTFSHQYDAYLIQNMLYMLFYSVGKDFLRRLKW
jgi:hypothetical protein